MTDENRDNLPLSERDKKCLSLCQLGKIGRLYSIGPFFKSGLTVFKQQVRALNLIYAIHNTSTDTKHGMAIVGGGVAGVTAAAAAVALGWEVYLFEQRPVLCHLQNGCDTRWLHPHIYDWPEAGSDDPYAGLPLLNWKEGTAATVTEQVLTEFEEIAQAANPRLHRHLGATTQVADGCRVKWDNSQGTPRGGERKFGVIVLAVGFGIEAGVREGSTPSYWRNDSVNQPKPGITSEKPDLYFVTGTGDGGLIDLLRCRIKSFNQGRIIDELINAGDAKDVQLIERLRIIVKKWSELRRGANAPETNWLFKEYDELNKVGLLAELTDKLKARLRRDTAAILNGRGRTFSESLSLSSASMFNTLLTYVLYQLSAFSYVYGNFRSDSDEGATIEQRPVPDDREKPPARTVPFKFDHLTIRHGADRKQTLRSAGVSETEIDALENQQATEAELDTIQPLWPAGWWSTHISLPGWVREPIEFVPPATLTIASTFVSTLSDILIQMGQAKATTTIAEPAESDFRITLHRLLEIQGKPFFQQVAYYAGTRTKGSPGRVFDVQTGLVGLVCRLGKPITARNTDERNWEKLWKALDLTAHGAEPVAPQVQAILACPFFILSQGQAFPTRVCLVLFIDSEDPNFFNREILKTIFAASAGFVRNLDERVETGDVRCATRSFVGYETESRPTDQKILADYREMLEVRRDSEFEEVVKKLTFRVVRSFDAELQLPRLGRKPRDTSPILT